MINVHLNGDIVRCPDIAAIHKRANEIRELHRICIYNFHEDTCQAWQQSLINWRNVKKNGTCGKCMLCATDSCPGHVDRTFKGLRKKTFKIDSTIYRKISSTAHYLVKESNNRVLFITLTFPQFKKKITYNEINTYFSKFVKNLRNNYDCGGYIAVREFGKKTHRVHFHLLLSIPFVPFAALNDTWCNTIKDICAYSDHALTTDKKTLFIRNPGRALRYVCKYFAKGLGQSSDTRLVFISNNILQKPKQIKDSIENILSGYKGIFIQQTSDYTTSYRITNNKDFERFCNNFLYPFFELSTDKKTNIYSFPDKFP
jgi:hypothetical protein